MSALQRPQNITLKNTKTQQRKCETGWSRHGCKIATHIAVSFQDHSSITARFWGWPIPTCAGATDPYPLQTRFTRDNVKEGMRACSFHAYLASYTTSYDWEEVTWCIVKPCSQSPSSPCSMQQLTTTMFFLT